MHFNRIFLFLTFLITFIIPLSFVAIPEVSANEVGETVVERNVIEEFYYRLVLKDTRDFYDYVMLGIFIIGMLIVLVMKNTHYYTVKIPKNEEVKVIEIIEEKEVKEDNDDYQVKENQKRKKTYSRKKKDSIQENVD